MKKITIAIMLLSCISVFSQQKSTGVIALSSDMPEMTVNLTLDNTTQKATLEITGPSDVWFGIHFGHFGLNEGMRKGDDFVYTDLTQSGIMDGNYEGGYFPPNVDQINNWTVLSSKIVSGVRIIKIQRSFLGDGVNDFDFNYSDTNIDFACAKGLGFTEGLGANITSVFQIAYHGSNFAYSLSNNFKSSLGVEDFTLSSSVIYPNPASDRFFINANCALQKVSIYSQLGVLVKTLEVNNKNAEIDTKELKSGVYLIELQNENEKFWKKIIIK